MALLIGIAIEEGKIENLNQRVDIFFPQYKIEGDTALRIIDLMAMSSGLSWDERFMNPLSDIAIAYYGSNLDSLMKEQKVVDMPAKKWKYQCGNTMVLLMILEKATGVPIYKYAEQKLWIPIGATHEAYWGKNSENGLAKAFCCFYATPRDFCKLGLLVLNRGYYNGKQIVPASFIDTITKLATWIQYQNKNVDFYGLHFWITKYHKVQIPYFSGMFGQYIFVFPEQNAVVVRFGEMINELKVLPNPPDVALYLKVADKFIK